MASDRDQALLEAVMSVAAGLEVGSTLRRIVRAAVDLSGATYGALGVLGPHGRVQDFIHVGMAEALVEEIGDLPTGRGVLGLLIDHPVALRIDDISSHPSATGFPTGHPAMGSFLGVPVRVRGRVFGNLYLTDKRDGEHFTIEDEHTVIALAAAAAVAIENARLFEFTRLRGLWLNAITRIDNAVLSGASTEEVLTLIAADARELTGASTAVIALADGQELTVEIVETAPDVTSSVLLGTSVLEGVTPEWGPAVMPLPLRSPERTLGVLYLVWEDPADALGEEMGAVAESFAAQAAVNIVLAEARHERERLSIFEDRDRIARDLHDLVIQRLFATGMQLQGATRHPDLPEDVTDRISRAVDDLDETIREIRHTIFALHEPVTTRGDAPRARLLREIAQSSALLGFDPAVRFIGPVDTTVAAPLAEHLCAVVREALTNVAKHARAHNVEVTVKVGAGMVTLTVSDDGIGFTDSGRQSGLANMASRAHDLAGGCTIESIVDQPGTQLLWWAPLLRGT